MTRTRIFVSSTYFDLAQVREDIRATILQMGHEPVLNEYPSFPVNPSLDTVENCKKAVQDTDIFLLIIGGRRGSLDSITGKSITNIEFDTAVQSGIDCFVFVNEQVMTVLPVWKKNEDADFTTYVDSPKVFEFIAKIQAEQRWVFTFKRASEISEILRNQLSIFLKDLLDRKKGGKIDPIPEFAAETPRARQLALDRPKLWEYRLSEELLRSKLSALRREYKEFENGYLFKPGKRMDARDYMDSINLKFSEVSKIVGIIKAGLENDLMEACGKPGEPGDAKAILRAVNKMVDACRLLLDWELEVDSWSAPPKVKAVGEKLRGFSLSVLSEVEKIPEQIAQALEGEWTGTRKVNIMLTLTFPSQLENFRDALNELIKNPSWWKD
jgi:Domain of unknown function (DUF4062)